VLGSVHPCNVARVSSNMQWYVRGYVGASQSGSIINHQSRRQDYHTSQSKGMH
jgi:hypothetical protein